MTTTVSSPSTSAERGRRSRRRVPALLAVPAAVAALVAAVAFGAPTAHATPSTVVVPNSLATVDGNNINSIPFDCGQNGAVPSMRYQQIYAGGQVGSGSITQVAFRDGVFAPTVIPNVTIRMSTSSKAVTGLSTTFANNVGADVATVFSGNLTLSGSGGATPGPFDIVIPLQTPFPFNGANGNLLLDVTIPTCVKTAFFDADVQDLTAIGIARVYSFTSGATTGRDDDGSWGGLVTQFSGVTTGCTSPKTGQPVACPKPGQPPGKP